MPVQAAALPQRIHHDFRPDRRRADGGDFKAHRRRIHPAELHLAGFRFPDISGGFLAGVVSGIEVFSIWSVVVTGIGVSVIAGISRKKAYIIVGVLFALGLLLTGLSGVVGASFTGM
jgi:hypothetical protein